MCADDGDVKMYDQVKKMEKLEGEVEWERREKDNKPSRRAAFFQMVNILTSVSPAQEGFLFTKPVITRRVNNLF